MHCEQIEIPMPWGFVKGQIFGDKINTVPILALHGYLDNSNSFKPLAPILCASKEYHVIAVDLPGQGLSSKISDPMLYNLKTFLYSIRKIVLHLNLKKFIFLTHSFGCTLATMVSTQFYLIRYFIILPAILLLFKVFKLFSRRYFINCFD